jgi:hypothetical protein
MRLIPDSNGSPDPGDDAITPLSEKHIKKDSMFTAKAQRCHGHVSGKVDNKYAVCNAALGSRAYKKKHR